MIAVIGGLVLLLTRGDDNNDSGTATSALTAQLQDKFLNQTVVDVDKGISVRRPGNWSHTNSHGVITLKSRDRCLAMTLSAPRPAGQAKRLRSDSAVLFKRSYKNAQVRPAPGAQVGGTDHVRHDRLHRPEGQPDQGPAQRRDGPEVRLPHGDSRQNPRCQGDLQLAQVALSSIQYTK